jgi:hypothetical protein
MMALRQALCGLPEEGTRAFTQRRGRLVLAALSTLAWGCSVSPEAYDGEAQKGSTHAVVAVSRQDALNSPPRGDALAGFVHLPATADRNRALELAGLGIELPEPGQCWRAAPERSTGALAGVSSIEFLDAGRVRLIAGNAEPHELAPHAFPTIADFISGVVYASRDRSGEGLPPGQLYRIETGSDGSVAELSASHEAPPLPADVTLSGAPFEGVDQLVSGQPLDVTWSVSSDGTDRFYVELAATGASVVCTFDDATGAGTVPTDTFSSGTDAHLSLHRVRVARTVPQSEAHEANDDAPKGVDQLELRFDFSVSRSVFFK